MDDNHVLIESTPFNNACDLTECGCFNSHPQILCKPSVEAFEAAIRIANVDPKKTVRLITYLKSDMGQLVFFMWLFVYNFYP